MTIATTKKMKLAEYLTYKSMILDREDGAVPMLGLGGCKAFYDARTIPEHIVDRAARWCSRQRVESGWEVLPQIGQRMLEFLIDEMQKWRLIERRPDIDCHVKERPCFNQDVVMR